MPEATDAPAEIYRNRTTRVWCGLSQQHFEWHNRRGHYALDDIGGGCLDAPDQLPAGSMRRYYCRTESFVATNLISRPDASLEEIARRNALAALVITEIIQEEATR